MPYSESDKCCNPTAAVPPTDRRILFELLNKLGYHVDIDGNIRETANAAYWYPIDTTPVPVGVDSYNSLRAQVSNLQRRLDELDRQKLESAIGGPATTNQINPIDRPAPDPSL